MTERCRIESIDARRQGKVPESLRVGDCFGSLKGRKRGELPMTSLEALGLDKLCSSKRSNASAAMAVSIEVALFGRSILKQEDPVGGLSALNLWSEM